jgi:Zn-dependent peptidase ImmA (M78 family)
LQLGTPMTEYSDEEWEEIARAWRDAAGQTGSTRFDAFKFIRWLKYEGYITDYVCVPDHELPFAKGKYDPNERRVYYPLSVWNAAERGEPHALWTIVHEASHAILQHQDVRYRAAVSIKIKSSWSTRRDEFEAHRLTACILAPFNKANFKPGMTANEIRMLFGLSPEAARRRLEEFERIYRRKHGIPRQLPPGIVDFLAEQKRKGYRVKSLDAQAPLPRPQAQFEGDPCPSCGAFKLVRSGLARKCESCGASTGDD